VAEENDRDEGHQAKNDDSSDIRASDSERDAVVARLNEAVGEGRLTLQEFSDRIDKVYAARTHGELAPLTGDLPAMPPVHASSRTRRLMLGLMFGGSKRSGPQALEEDITAVALLGDVEIDLCDARVTTKEITIHAWAIINDVEVIIPEGVAVELSGVAVKGDLENWVTPVSPGTSRFVVKIQGHAVLGDVEVRRPWPKKAVRGWRRRSIES
jgi:Domain of unknown function (DUF1707)/Cell wall-active antibiotics response 4TMS YvqF